MNVTEDGGKTFEPLGEQWKHVDNHAMVDRSRQRKPPVDRLRRRPVRDVGPREELQFHTQPADHAVLQDRVDNDAPFYNVYGGTQDNATQGGPTRTRNVHGIRNSDWFITVFGDGFDPGRRSGRPEHRLLAVAIRWPGPLRPKNGRADRHQAAGRQGRTSVALELGFADSDQPSFPHASVLRCADPVPQRRPRRHVDGHQPRLDSEPRPQQAEGHGTGLGRRRGRQERFDVVLRFDCDGFRIAAGRRAAIRRHRRRPGSDQRRRRPELAKGRGFCLA